VLIISQFIQEDGEVLPPHVTGLCYKAHLRLQRVVRQAQYAGLKCVIVFCLELKPNKNVALLRVFKKLKEQQEIEKSRL